MKRKAYIDSCKKNREGRKKRKKGKKFFEKNEENFICLRKTSPDLF